jgi:hypothetical protein
MTDIGVIGGMKFGFSWHDVCTMSCKNLSFGLKITGGGGTNTWTC